MKNESVLQEYQPQWSAKVMADKGGLDPLGLDRVSEFIADTLLTGIITQTDRARYYSFYSWALWHIQKEDHPKRYQDFVDGFRRREAFMALASLEDNPGRSPIGVTVTKQFLIQGKADKEINCDFRVLPSNALGGYGQYYAGSLYNLGLRHRPEDGIDRVTPGFGEELANLYHRIAQKSSYVKKCLSRKRRVLIEDFKKSAPFFSLDALLLPEAGLERKKLIELFFGFDQRLASEASTLRRLSLAQMLYIIDQYDKNGFPVNTEKNRKMYPVRNKKGLDWCIVYPPYYYGELWLKDNKSTDYAPPEQFGICHAMWQQFCLHQFFTESLECILSAVLMAIEEKGGSLDVAIVSDELIKPPFLSVIKSFAGKKCDKPADLFKTFRIDCVPNESVSTKMQREISLLHPKNEIAILNLGTSQPSSLAAMAVLLLMVLYLKWRRVEKNVGMNCVAGNVAGKLWAGNFLPLIDDWFDPTLSWKDGLAKLTDFILEQHDRVKYLKGSWESSWIERNERNLLKEQDYDGKWKWRSSRHRNAVSILQDLQFLSIKNNGDMVLTRDGKAILKDVVNDKL